MDVMDKRDFARFEFKIGLNVVNHSVYSCYQMAKLLAAVSKELPNMKTARKPSRALWDAGIGLPSYCQVWLW